MKKILITRKLIKESEDKAVKTFKPIFNTNDDGGQTVYHIHLHLIGGEKLKAF